MRIVIRPIINAKDTCIVEVDGRAYVVPTVVADAMASRGPVEDKRAGEPHDPGGAFDVRSGGFSVLPRGGAGKLAQGLFGRSCPFCKYEARAVMKTEATSKLDDHVVSCPNLPTAVALGSLGGKPVFEFRCLRCDFRTSGPGLASTFDAFELHSCLPPIIGRLEQCEASPVSESFYVPISGTGTLVGHLVTHVRKFKCGHEFEYMAEYKSEPGEQFDRGRKIVSRAYVCDACADARRKGML